MQNIFYTALPVTGISHPYIANMYIKKDAGSYSEEPKGKTLIIEARKPENEKYELKDNGFESYLYDLLLDVEDLKKKAEEKVGAFDHIDIRTA